MLRLPAVVAVTLSLLALSIAPVLAAPPTLLPSGPSSVTVPPSPPPPAPNVTIGCGAGNVDLCNPNSPHPMFPWGPGQIGGERYGQVIRYWEQQPQVVNNVILVLPEGQQQETPPQSEPQQQGPPAAPPPTIGPAPAQGGAVEPQVAKAPPPQTVTVPGARIIETTRGYIHMPRWVLRELGDGRYEWAWVGAWFQPR